MKRFKVGRRCASFVIPVGLLVLVMVVAWAEAVSAQGVSIKVNAKNRSITDTPFCGLGGGAEGDKLKVNVFTDLSGVTTGTATFTDAGRNITTLNIDEVFGFAGGIALRDNSNSNVIAIWLDETYSPVHVNVELPGGCDNTVSTFTSGVDKVSVQIKVK